MVRSGVFFLSVVAVLFGNAGVAYAGFGITPPYINNDRLTHGTVYQQRIDLVRSDPTEDLTADITMNVPVIQDWITVDRGTKFTLPAGQRDVPIIVTITVPANAEYKEYKGAIRIRTSTTNAPAGGGVSIALGAQINVDVTVVDKIYDFNVRQVSIGDFEEGRTKWGLFFPGKIRFSMMIQNTGNTDFGPTRVHFDIYDSNDQTLLESVDNTNALQKVPPFAIQQVEADLPTRLPTGSYIARYTIYKNADIAQQNELTLSISAIGSIPGYKGYGFDGLSLADKFRVILVVGVPTLLLILFVAMMISRRNRRKRQGSYARGR